MPDPNNDADQLRFSQIRSRMLSGLVKHLPESFMESAGIKSRAKLLVALCESDHILSIVDTCAFVAQSLEEEKASRRPGGSSQGPGR